MIGIRLDAGGDVGAGHLLRCLPLAAEWERMGHDVLFFCKMNDYTQHALQAAGMPFLEVPDTSLESELEFMRQQTGKLHILLLDSYRLSDGYIDGLHTPGLLLCAMDDDALYRYSCDVVINPHPFAERLEFRTGRKTPRFLLGSKYWLLREEFKDCQPVSIEPEVRNVLALMGGADINNYMPTVLQALRDEGVSVTAVLGPMAAGGGAIRELASQIPDVRVIESPPSMALLMSQSDIAISAGGNTVYELCAMGLPSIIVPQSDNERVKADHLSRDNVIVSPGDYREADANTLRELFRRFRDDASLRREQAERMRGLIPRDGARRLAWELLTL